MKMRNLYDINIKVKTNDGKEELKSYSNRYGYNDETFSWHGSSESIKKVIESLPEYTRGKLKGEMQRCKYSDDLIISESYYNKIKANRGFDWTSDELTTKETFYFPDIPALFITAKATYQNALTIMRTIEKKAIGDYKHVSSFNDLRKCAELFEQLKKFRACQCYQLYIEKRPHFDDLFYLYADLDGNDIYLGELYSAKIKTLQANVKLPKEKQRSGLGGVLSANYETMLKNENDFELGQLAKMDAIIQAMKPQEKSE